MEQDEALNGEGVELEPENDQSMETVEETRPAKDPATMESLLDQQGLELDFPKPGEVRTGVIATIGENEILVSVGAKSEGMISGRELEQIPEEERAAFEIGTEIPVFIVTPEDSHGNVVLSYTRAREVKDWEDAERLLGDAEPFESTIIGYNKGGLLVPLGQLRGFVPASQISLLRRSSISGDTPEERWGKMVGEPITACVIEVDRERRRLILSERAALQETRESLKDRLLDDLSVGDVRTGRVTSLADFGAFVNIDGADGLVHLSEISWDRIQHPNEVLKVGEEIEVKVISIDRDRKRIGLSIRQLQDDPWLKKVEGLREGQLIEATITHLTKFGAFARLDEELEGLIHISELSERRINHPKEVVDEGDEVTLRIIKIDPERRRIGLSLRKVDSAAYSDLDWKMALAEEVVEVREAEAFAPPGDAAPVDEDVAELQEEVEDAVDSEKEPAEDVAVDEGAESPVEGEASEIEVEAELLEEEEANIEAEDEPVAEIPTEPKVEATKDTGDAADNEPEIVEEEESSVQAEIETKVDAEAESLAQNELAEDENEETIAAEVDPETGAA
ncbi:MAG: S1 RNA-binding domain-containing protein [Anaerolineales bacterium]